MQDVKAASVYASVEFRIDKKSWQQLDRFSARIDKLKKKFDNFTRMKARGTNQVVQAIRREDQEEERRHKNRMRREDRELARRSKARSRRAVGAASKELTFMDRMERLGIEPDQIAKYQKELKLLGDQYRRNEISTQRYNFRVKQLNSQLSQQAQQANKLNKAYTKFRTTMIGLTAAWSALSAATQVGGTGQRFESMQTLFNTVFKGQSANEMTFLKEESDRLGVSLLDSAKSYAQLSFAAREAGATVEEIRDIYSSFTEASVVMGVSQDETMGIFRALIQMYSKTTAQAEELRGQLGDRLVGAWQLSADAMGMTTEEFDKAVTNRLIKANELIPALAQGIRKHVAGGLSQAVDNLAQKERRLMNAWQEFQMVIFDAGMGDAFKTLVDGLAEVLENLKPLASFLGTVLRPVIFAITTAVRILAGAFRDIITLGGKISDTLFGKGFNALQYHPVVAALSNSKFGNQTVDKKEDESTFLERIGINVSVDPNSGMLIANMIDKQVESKIVSELESSAGE